MNHCEMSIGEIENLVGRLFTGDQRAAARLISLVENSHPVRKQIISRIFHQSAGKAFTLGITGPMGAGKSSLINQLINRYRKQNTKIGIVLIDPTSPISGGALLGDRIRLRNCKIDPNVFIRSLATRGHSGGTANAICDVIRILEAMGNDIIIIETTGTGQNEIDIRRLVHTCLLVLTPHMGDHIQALKAGIMEIPDIIVLNKADLEGSERYVQQLRSTTSIGKYANEQGMPMVIPTIADAAIKAHIDGIEMLMEAIATHEKKFQGGQFKQVEYHRIHYELGCILQNTMKEIISNGLQAVDNSEYIESIKDGRRDPYSAAHEIIEKAFPQREFRHD